MYRAISCKVMKTLQIMTLSVVLKIGSNATIRMEGERITGNEIQYIVKYYP